MNIGKCPGVPPPKNASDKERKVSGGPKYAKADVLSLLGASAITIWTVRCGKHIQMLGLDMSEVADIVTEAISKGKFICSEWCSQNPAGPDAICDAYVLTRSEWIKAANRKMDCEYYIKLAINKGGNVLLLVSCHTSN